MLQLDRLHPVHVDVLWGARDTTDAYKDRPEAPVSLVNAVEGVARAA